MPTLRRTRRCAIPAVAVLAVLAAGCRSEPGKPNLFGIPLPDVASKSDDDLTARQQRQLEVFGRTVRNPSPDIDPGIRRQAAEELIAMDVPGATEQLASALRSAEPAVVMAVIDAMEARPEPVEGLLEAAAETLQDAEGQTLEKLSLVLARYGEPALRRVAALARNRDQAPARRVGPIYALSDFRSRESAVQLMELLDEERDEPPEVVAATGESLERLTGLPYGADARQWRRWWDKLEDQPIEDWLRIMVLHLSTKTAELERDVHSKTRQSQQIAERLAETLRDLFVAMPADEQLERLPELLGDELAPVRRFALGRVERRLRDSERIPEPLQEIMAARLNDERELPGSRLLAARLLSDLNYEATPDLVAAALRDEEDPEIAAGFLEILAKRPHPSALEAALLWLDDAVAGEAAADAVWAMLVAGMVDEESLPTTRRAIDYALKWRTTPAHVRLLAALGELDAESRIPAFLDGPDPALRRAAAQGLSFAGRLAPLMARVNEAEIYPFVVRRVAAGPATVATLQSVLELTPPEAERQLWLDSLRDVAKRLPPANLLDADDALAAHGGVGRSVRAEILARVADVPADELDNGQRVALQVRLAELRIALGEYQRAYDVLVWPDGGPAPPELARVKFDAAVLAGHYDDAAAVTDEPVAWVSLLERTIERSPDAAPPIRDEIRRRFGPALQGDAAAMLRAAEQHLARVTAAASEESDGRSP